MHAITGVGATGKVVRCRHRADDGQSVHLREGVVTLVFGRNGHDGAGAVVAEHVVGHVDRYGFVVKRVDHVRAREGTALVEAGTRVRGRRALKLTRLRGAANQFLNDRALLIGREISQQWVLGGNDGVGHAKARVGARRKDPQLLRGVVLEGQRELDALRAPNPVALHRFNALGPFQRVDVVQQFFGVGSDLEEPLLEVLALNEVARSVTGAVGIDLLVGQYGGTPRAPVHGRFSSIGQTGLQEPQENRLCPLHVTRVVTKDFTTPVVDGTQTSNRVLQLPHAGVGKEAWVAAGLNGGIFRRQAKGVEAKRG